MGLLFRRRGTKWMQTLTIDRHVTEKYRSLGLVCLLLGGAVIALTYKFHNHNIDVQSHNSHGAGRHLLATDNTTHNLPVWERCEEEEASGVGGVFVFIYIVCILIIFVALAIVCDDFFVPSLEAISEKLKLSEDVAGATFMAAGSSAPELFTSVAGVAFETDVGVGTIVGSAVFNILIIIALTAALAGQVLNLDWRPLIRDSFCYFVSICLFIYFAWDGKFQVWEAVILLVLYILYIVLMAFNPKLMDWMATWRCICCKKSEVLPVDAESGETKPADSTEGATEHTQVDHMANGGSHVQKDDKKSTNANGKLENTQSNGYLSYKAEYEKPENNNEQVCFTGGHARRLSLISQRSGDLHMPDAHYFRHQRGSIMGALFDKTPPVTPAHSDKDSGFKSTDNSIFTPSREPSNPDLPRIADANNANEAYLKPPVPTTRGWVNNGYIASDPGEQHSTSKPRSKSMKVKFFADEHASKQIEFDSPVKNNDVLSLERTRTKTRPPLASRFSEPNIRCLPPIQTNYRHSSQDFGHHHSVSMLPPIRHGEHYITEDCKHSTQELEMSNYGTSSQESISNNTSLLNQNTPTKTPILSTSDPTLNSDLQHFPQHRLALEDKIEEERSSSCEEEFKDDIKEEKEKEKEEKEEAIPEEEEEEEAEEEEETINMCPCLKCCPRVRTYPPRKGGSGCWETLKFILRWIIFVVSFPFVVLFSWTIPDCSKDHNRKWFILSFICSVLWIAILSFGMVLLVGRTGCILDIDTFVMGLVVIAIGTSVPDALSSILVAREGYGDMAVSNAIGSNVFDINLGLGLPFLITIAVKKGEPLNLLRGEEILAFANGTMLITPHSKFGFCLLLILGLCLFIFALARFRLNKIIGISFVIMYILFLTYAFVQEAVCNHKC